MPGCKASVDGSIRITAETAVRNSPLKRALADCSTASTFRQSIESKRLQVDQVPAESVGVAHIPDGRIEAWVETQADLFGGYETFLTLLFDDAPGPMTRTLGFHATTVDAIAAAYTALLEMTADDADVDP